LEEFWIGPAEINLLPETESEPQTVQPSQPARPIIPGKEDNANEEPSPVSREVDIWLENLKRNKGSIPDQEKEQPKPGAIYSLLPRSRRSISYLVGFAVLLLFAFNFAKTNGINVKNNILSNGNNAVVNLEDAKQKLANFDFMNAADSFALAYEDFNKASSTLNQLGNSFVALFGNLPGMEQLKAANNLIEAGRNISKAGENLSLAFGNIYKTNVFSFLKTTDGNNGNSLGKTAMEFKDVLVSADNNIKKATSFLADIDSSVIPADKQQLFIDFKQKVPEFQKYIGEAIDYSDFLLKFVGDKQPKTYLVLLQNNNELRATGGFPGTYALLTFDNGYLKKIFVDDIYQLDGGTSTNVIPPVQLQHITPTWGVRDANWFADFPTSAKKIEEMYKLDGGTAVDGVLTLTPDVITKMLDVVGPIDMPEYGMKLDSNNFLDQIQSEVEYKADRAKPKKIISDLEPKFLEKLGQQDKDHWLEIFKILLSALNEKHMLAYFNDSALENTAQNNNFAGNVKDVPSDYLQVVLTNVKGSKTDSVTDTAMGLKVTTTDSGDLEHQLTVSRVHNGGDSKYGFYNRENPNYVRVYAPLGSTLESINGNSITDFQPLVDYSNGAFKKDADLASLEQGTAHPFDGVDVYEESGKTVFGFWLVVKPKEKRTVTLNYKTPTATADREVYDLLWQKQSGTDNIPFSFSFQLPDGKRVFNQTAGLNSIGSSLMTNSNLDVDKEIKIEYK
jgi:hypothetical protein